MAVSLCSRDKVGRARSSLALVVAAVALSSTLAHEAAIEHGLHPDDDDTRAWEGADAQEGEPRLFDEPLWGELAARVQHAVDAPGMLRARRWANIANGVLLSTTGPVSFLLSAFSLKLSKAVLSVYLTALGAALAALELGSAPIAPWIRVNLSYLATPRGKTALIAVAGGLAWTFGKPALLAALLTCGNAAFNLNFDRILRFVTADEREAAGETEFYENADPYDESAYYHAADGAEGEPDNVLQEPTEEPTEEPRETQMEEPIEAQMGSRQMEGEDAGEPMADERSYDSGAQPPRAGHDE